MPEPVSIVYNMDCMDYMLTMPDKAFDLAIVDPPYGIGEDGESNHSRDRLAKAKRYAPKNWDLQYPEPEYFYHLRRVSRNQIIWGANYYKNYLPASMGWIFWDKHASGDFSAGELAYTSFDRALEKFDFTWMGMRQGDMKNKENHIHPTQKPVALHRWLLERYANPGDKILDTHPGSGSSRIAAFDLGFDFYGTELDKEYFEMEEDCFLSTCLKQPWNKYSKKTSLFEGL